jgi:two-component system OmpR family response regulator
MATRPIVSVLYVDDDPDICETVKTTLCLMAGLDVYTAGSGEEAIEVARALRPDLVLMDVTMPGLDGPSTLKRMRGDTLLANIPVIFLTANVAPAELARLHRLRALGVIGKPFDPLTLCNEIFALWPHSAPDGDTQAAQGVALEVRAPIDSLSGRFLERTRLDVDRLREIIAGAYQGDRSFLAEAKHVAHSIHGAGAMFGFADVSAAGGSIERLIGHLETGASSPGVPCSTALLQELTDLTEQLGRCAHRREGAVASGGMFAENQ